MQYFENENYDYIMNKYRDATKPFDGMARFSRNDPLFSSSSGMAPEEIIKGIWAVDEQNREQAHPIRKAKAFSFILKNTRISCDCRDRFPAINMIDRPLNSTLINAWRREVFTEIIPDVEKKRSALERDGIVTIWPDYDHSVPVWERVLSLGFVGLLRESEEARKKKAWDEESENFFEGIKITYEGVISFIGRLADRAEKDGSARMAKALRQIQSGAPESFYEALLTDYLYFMISEHIDALQVRSLSHFDRIFYPFYQSDIEKGVSEEEIRRDLAYFLLQFVSIANYWNQPIFLGGEKADGETEVNDLSYLFLDTYDQMGIYNPKVQIKLAESTPREFTLKALDMIRRGHNSIVFVCDKTIRTSLMNRGISKEEARLCNVTGCYEYSVRGGYGTGMNYLNLLKPLEYALHEGRDGVTGVMAGIPCRPPEQYESFEAFLYEYKAQLRYVIDATVETVNAFEDYLSHINPLSLLSATFPTCIESGRDAIGGGARTNGSGIGCGFIGDLADSLAMIKKYVFDRREISLSALVMALDRNFEGDEALRLKLFNDRDKYGNNRDLPDALAVEIVNFIVDNTQGRPNAEKRGGRWGCGFHVARMSYTQGKKTAASPNGRRLGEELSKNVSPSMGVNREGATAAILSATKIDATSFSSDAALDLGLLPSAVQGEDGLNAMYGLLLTFMRRGGHALHINVFDAKTLRDAQAHPEKYQDLQIRVCGWNVLFNNICKEEQDGFIRQAEALV